MEYGKVILEIKGTKKSIDENMYKIDYIINLCKGSRVSGTFKNNYMSTIVILPYKNISKLKKLAIRKFETERFDYETYKYHFSCFENLYYYDKKYTTYVVNVNVYVC